ncbi:MAG: hypothetical protein K1Y36_05950 [Blastocatellia bacterium]|nr:hypothetical protein [Blastocatellia bacterium]
MKLQHIFPVCAVLLVLWGNFSATGSAQSQSRSYPVERIRRDPVQVTIFVEGSPAPVYPDGPYRWIEGRRGQRFAFHITNPNAFPVGVIPSADGHSLTADGRASASHPAYVVQPYETITVSLWREDLQGGRELVFTSIDQSLAARKGDRRNIGVLGVLVWQLEDRYQQRPVPLQKDRESAENRKTQPGTAGKSADSSIYQDNGGIGVGAGNRVGDSAYLTDQYRRVRVLGTVSLYYDDRPGLIRAGVLLDPYEYRQPRDRRRANPFPGEYKGVRIP